jgi:hypothetical protein
MNGNVNSLSIPDEVQAPNETTSRVVGAVSRVFRAIADRTIYCLPKPLRVQLFKGPFIRAILKIPEDQRVNAIQYALDSRLDQMKRDTFIRSLEGRVSQADLETNDLITPEIASSETMEVIRKITKYPDHEIRSVLPLALLVYREGAKRGSLIYTNDYKLYTIKDILSLPALERAELVGDANSILESNPKKQTRDMGAVDYLADHYLGGREYWLWKQTLELVHEKCRRSNCRNRDPRGPKPLYQLL